MRVTTVRAHDSERPSRAHPPGLALVLPCLALLVLGELPAVAAEGEPPPGVEQILPRGGIPAVFEPRFVPAGEAEIPDDAWVLGVVVEGVAKAYSLNLLNRHEVVNDRSGTTDFAAVWRPLANTAVVYGRSVEGRTLELEPSGALLQAALVMRDRQTDSWWSIMTSDAIGGPLHGTRLPELPVGEKTTWGTWRREHPDTVVLSVDGVEHVESNPYDNYFASERTFRDLGVSDDRLPAKEPIYAFQLDGEPFAVAHRTFAGGTLLEIPGTDSRLLVHRQQGASIYASSEAWLVESAAIPERHRVGALLDAARRGEEGFSMLAGFDTFWYTWAGAHPGTALLDGP